MLQNKHSFNYNTTMNEWKMADPFMDWATGEQVGGFSVYNKRRSIFITVFVVCLLHSFLQISKQELQRQQQIYSEHKMLVKKTIKFVNECKWLKNTVLIIIFFRKIYTHKHTHTQFTLAIINPFQPTQPEPTQLTQRFTLKLIKIKTKTPFLT